MERSQIREFLVGMDGDVQGDISTVCAFNVGEELTESKFEIGEAVAQQPRRDKRIEAGVFEQAYEVGTDSGRERFCLLHEVDSSDLGGAT